MAHRKAFTPLGAATVTGEGAAPNRSQLIGRIPETQEMLDFCTERGIVADIEMVRADQVNDAYERMLKGDVAYRFVIDSASLGD